MHTWPCLLIGNCDWGGQTKKFWTFTTAAPHCNFPLSLQLCPTIHPHCVGGKTISLICAPLARRKLHNMCTIVHLTLSKTISLNVKGAKSSIFFFKSFWLISSSVPGNSLLHTIWSNIHFMCNFLTLFESPKMKTASNLVNGTRVLCSINQCSPLD